MPCARCGEDGEPLHDHTNNHGSWELCDECIGIVEMVEEDTGKDCHPLKIYDSIGATPYGVEYRWENIRFGQGHYFLAKSLKEAKEVASSNVEDDVVVLQQWKPKSEKKILFKPPLMASWDTDKILRHYIKNGYDEKIIGKILKDVDPNDIFVVINT